MAPVERLAEIIEEPALQGGPAWWHFERETLRSNLLDMADRISDNDVAVQAVIAQLQALKVQLQGLEDATAQHSQQQQLTQLQLHQSQQSIMAQEAMHGHVLHDLQLSLQGLAG